MQNQEGQQQPPVMMSLLEKYSKMDSQMDYVRQETAKVQLEIQQRQTKTQELFEEREQMKQLQERTLQQQLDLTNGAEMALQKIHQIAEERAQAESKREEAQARLDRMKQRSNDYRQQFLQASRTFRSQCKRLKMTGQSLGMLNAPLAAHALVNQPHLVQVFEEPDNDHDGGDDLEYANALKKSQELEKSRVESKRERDEWQVKKDRLTERSNKRKTQQANLQAQLDRLLNDVQKIQGQIQTVQAQASRNSRQSKNDLQSMDPAPTRRHSTAPTPAATIHNPYSRPNRISPQAAATNTQKIDRHSTSTAIHDSTLSRPSTNMTNGAGNSNNNSNRTEQYPHRVGRLRTSRDFGLSLRIEDEDSDDSDDELLSYVAFRK